MKQARKATFVLLFIPLTTLQSHAAKDPVKPAATTLQRSSIRTVDMNKTAASLQELREEVIKTCFPVNEKNTGLFPLEEESFNPWIKQN